MNIDLETVALREVAMLDQLEAHLLHMADEHPAQRRAINSRLVRLRRLRNVWIQAARTPKGGHFDPVHDA